MGMFFFCFQTDPALVSWVWWSSIMVALYFFWMLGVSFQADPCDQLLPMNPSAAEAVCKNWGPTHCCLGHLVSEPWETTKDIDEKTNSTVVFTSLIFELVVDVHVPIQRGRITLNKLEGVSILQPSYTYGPKRIGEQIRCVFWYQQRFDQTQAQYWISSWLGGTTGTFTIVLARIIHMEVSVSS